MHKQKAGKNIMELAIKCHRSGNLKGAADIYEDMLRKDSEHADVWHLLGLIAYQEGRLGRAVKLIRKAVTVSPETALYWNNLGSVLQAQEKIAAAVDSYKRAIVLDPEYGNAHCNLGYVFKSEGRYRQALIHLRKAVEFQPRAPEPYDAIGAILKSRGEFRQAITCFQMAIELDPRYARAYFNLGLCLESCGEVDRAVHHYEEAVGLLPAFPEAHNNLANALRLIGEPEKALRHYNAALLIRPDFAEAHNNLGNMLSEAGRPNQGLTHLKEAVRLNPNMGEAQNNLANAMLRLGRLDEALTGLKRAVDSASARAGIGSNFLFNLHYRCSDREFLFEKHKRWGECQVGAWKDRLRPCVNNRDRRRLRLGYVSPDFCFHPVAFFLRLVFKHHDRSRFEIFCYSDVRSPDGETKYFQKQSDHWRDIRGMADDQLMGCIYNDQVDVLVDLAGHSTNNRLSVFAGKPAPVQVSYLGYPDTTGLSTMDYRITDAYADPPGISEAYHTEVLFRLPSSFLCYEPLPDRPKNSMVPVRKSGAVTFGCFNNMLKITPDVIAVWADILKALPSSTILLKSHQFSHAEAVNGIKRAFRKQGVADTRIKTLGRTHAFLDHLALYNRIDIGLDPFPYNGTTTTCEALSMGVPVIVLAGRRHISRVGVSILSNVGMERFIAYTRNEYTQKAVELAQAKEVLQGLRSMLPLMLADSPLADGAQYTQHLEAAYTDMWYRWCER